MGWAELVRRGRLPQGGSSSEGGFDGACAGMGCVLNAAVAPPTKRSSDDLRHMPKVALLESRPDGALLQRRQERSPPGGRQTSSPDGVLGAAQKRRVEGPTGTRNNLEGKIQTEAKRPSDLSQKWAGRRTPRAESRNGNFAPGACIACGASCPRFEGRCEVCDRPLCSRPCARAHEPRCRAHRVDEFTLRAPPRFVWPGVGKNRKDRKERQSPTCSDKDDRQRLRAMTVNTGRKGQIGIAPSPRAWSPEGCPPPEGTSRMCVSRIEHQLKANEVCLQCLWEVQAGGSPRRCPWCGGYLCSEA